jgi:type 1 glutamine amidotransferase
MFMMRISCCGLIAALLVTAFPALQAAEKPAKIKMLLISGDDAAPAHNWREMAQATVDVLEASGKFDVKVCEDMFILEATKALENYDVIFLARFNRVGTLSDQGKENLLSFVKSGKGFVVSHLASASFKEWTEFKKLCGRNWVMGTSGHGPRGTFKVKIVNRDSPITKGLQDFEADDELYAKLQGDTPINVLVEADSDWSKKTEPLVFTLSYGQGRVFHEAFGHDGKAIKNPAVQKIIVQGCQWAATGKVD